MALDALNEKDLSPDLQKVLEQFQENCSTITCRWPETWISESGFRK